MDFRPLNDSERKRLLAALQADAAPGRATVPNPEHPFLAAAAERAAPPSRRKAVLAGARRGAILGAIVLVVLGGMVLHLFEWPGGAAGAAGPEGLDTFLAVLVEVVAGGTAVIACFALLGALVGSLRGTAFR
jgi:hypothetical protein